MGTLFNLPVFGAWSSSLSTMWTTSSSTVKDGPTKENAILSSVLSTTTSSLACESSKGITNEIAQQYIDSLSEEKLAELSEKIVEKEHNFTIETNSKDNDIVVKVKTNRSKEI